MLPLDATEENSAMDGSGTSLNIIYITLPFKFVASFFGLCFTRECTSCISFYLTYLYLSYPVAGQGSESSPTSGGEGSKKGMILPFQPLTMTFRNVNYFVDMPKVCFSAGFIPFAFTWSRM